MTQRVRVRETAHAKEVCGRRGVVTHYQSGWVYPYLVHFTGYGDVNFKEEELESVPRGKISSLEKQYGARKEHSSAI